MTFENEQIKPLLGIVALLPPAPLDDLIACTEICVQEGLETFSLSAKILKNPVANDIENLVSIYHDRARFGVHDITNITQIVESSECGADFVFSERLLSGLFDLCQKRQLACYLSALTPTEILTVSRQPVTGVQVLPAETLSPNYADFLATAGLISNVVPRYGLDSYAAQRWLQAGAPAVCADTELIKDALTGGDLADLRYRCASFIKATQQTS